MLFQIWLTKRGKVWSYSIQWNPTVSGETEEDRKGGNNNDALPLTVAQPDAIANLKSFSEVQALQFLGHQINLVSEWLSTQFFSTG